MDFEEEFLVATLILLIAGVIIGILVMIFTKLSEMLMEHNEKKAAEQAKKLIAQAHDEALFAQAKSHQKMVTEPLARDIKDEEFDFKVDFNVKLKGSTVKTETVYAD